MKKKSITLLVSCIIFLAIFPFSSLKAIQMMEPHGLSSSEEEINDMDPNIEEVIKETLSIIDRELTTSDLANLTVVNYPPPTLRLEVGASRVIPSHDGK
jgi:hypothetical protein